MKELERERKKSDVDAKVHNPNRGEAEKLRR
jgi:hypothetical protein